MHQYKNIQYSNNYWFHFLCQRTRYSHFTTRRKLQFLLLVASLALLGTIIISDQLLARHNGRKIHIEPYGRNEIPIDPYDQFKTYEDFDIITREEWTHKETADFDEPPIIVYEARDKDSASPITVGYHDLKSTSIARPFGISKMVEDGIFWSSELEAVVPRGRTDQSVMAKMQGLRNLKVQKLGSPNWLHCGREKNRFLEFTDGSNACARYRGPDHPEFLQGELMAFYLARLLGIANTPAVVLSEVENW